MTRKELAKAIYEKAYLQGEFRLRSGQISNEYFDKYQFESDPQLLGEIASHLSKSIPQETEYLAGLEMGGIAIAVALSLKTGIPCVFVRKTAKEYGTQKTSEGPDLNKKNVCIVEDVITTGGQVLLSTSELREQGAKIFNVLSVIDREQGGKEKLLSQGELSLHSLFTMGELKEAKS